MPNPYISLASIFLFFWLNWQHMSGCVRQALECGNIALFIPQAARCATAVPSGKCPKYVQSAMWSVRTTTADHNTGPVKRSVGLALSEWNSTDQLRINNWKVDSEMYCVIVAMLGNASPGAERQSQCAAELKSPFERHHHKYHNCHSS